MGTQSAPLDQQNVKQLMVVMGTVGTLDVAALKATAGATNVYQFNADFQFVFNKTNSTFRHGGVYALHADLKAALIAAQAPMTQV